MKIEVNISKDAPKKGGLWLKPIDGGVVAYVLLNKRWQPLKLVEDQGTASISDDVKQDLIGSVQDEASANTINGAKNYANAVAGELVGDENDAASTMTLYGLKNYIDGQIASLG